MSEFRLLFCSDPIDPRKPDDAFRTEVEAAQACGFKFLQMDHEALDHDHNARRAIRHIRDEGPIAAVYRGWMLRADDYRLLYDALTDAGIVLVNTPEQYTACHHMPEAYPHVAPWSAATIWLNLNRALDQDAIGATLAIFGSRPVVLKDWVKSQAAGYWDEACFIPDASDMKTVMRVVSRFLELQGESIIGGLVFREYIPLARADGQIKEWRAFILDGEPLGCWPRFAIKDHRPPPAVLLKAVARSLPARFATADFAQSETGRWIVVETGDGQVSGMPDAAPVADMFLALAAAQTSTISS
jgi:hypothetical protein